MACLECGGIVIFEVKKGGNQPGHCSEACRKAYRKRYQAQWTTDNRQNIANYKKTIPDRIKAWNKAFYARHRERRSKLANEWYHKNTEKALETQRRYSKAHPEAIRAQGRKSALTRRARLRDLFVEVVDPKVVFERDGGVCGICKQPIECESEWHVDHIIPISKGGPHAYANVQAAHGRCNRVKQDKVTAW